MATSEFGQAFSAARKAGKKEFTWRGKTYHTKTKEEMAGGGTKSSTGPKARPKAAAPMPGPAIPPRADAPKTVRSTPLTRKADRAVAAAERRAGASDSREKRYEDRAKRRAAKTAAKPAPRAYKDPRL